MGVFHPDLVGIQVRVLQRLGARNALIVYGMEGLDEISISAPTMVGELRDGEVQEYRITPEDVGLPLHAASAIRACNVEESRAILLGALDGSLPAPRDIVTFNAGASIYAAGVADSLTDGVERAQEAITSGAAMRKLEEFIEKSRSFAV